MKKSLKRNVIAVPLAAAVLFSASVLTGFSAPSVSAAETSTSKFEKNIPSKLATLASYTIYFDLNPNETKTYGPLYPTGKNLTLNIYDQYSSGNTDVDYKLYDENGDRVGYHEFDSDGDDIATFEVEKNAKYYLKIDNDSEDYNNNDIKARGKVVITY